MRKFSRYGLYGVARMILLAGAAGSLTTADELHAQQSAIEEEAIQKWKEFEHFSQTIQGTKRVTLTSAQILQKQPISYSDSYKQTRECVLFSSSGINASGVAPSKWWTLVNTRYAAEISTSNSDPNKVVLMAYEPNSVMDPSGTGFSVFDHIFFETAPHFTYRRTRLSQLVAKDTFKVKKMSKTSLDGYELIRIDYSFEDKKQEIQSRGSLYLDPAQCWCIRRISESYERALNGTPFWKMEQNVEYQTTTHPSGFPLVKSQSLHEQGYEGKKKVESTRKIDYEWEINDRVPDSEFTLTAFGLPEPVGVTWEKPTPWYLWFLAAASGCFVLALLFRYLSRRWRLAEQRERKPC